MKRLFATLLAMAFAMAHYLPARAADLQQELATVHGRQRLERLSALSPDDDPQLVMKAFDELIDEAIWAADRQLEGDTRLARVHYIITSEQTEVSAGEISATLKWLAKHEQWDNFDDCLNFLAEHGRRGGAYVATMRNRLNNMQYAAITAAVIIALLVAIIVQRRIGERRLRQTNEKLRVASEQAQEALHMKAEFMHNMSHEIRTPLNAIQGFAQLIADPDMLAAMSDAERQEAGQQIKANTQRITSLISKLLELADSSSRTHIERNDVVPCNQLCRMAATESHAADQKQVDFRLRSQLSDIITITTNAALASRALAELLQNALKFTPEGTVTLRCRQTNGYAQFVVEDTGCGVPAESAEHIFEEFVQLDSFVEGQGLGLSVSRNIVRRLGGDITLDTAYTRGARFVMTLPLGTATSDTSTATPNA